MIIILNHEINHVLAITDHFMEILNEFQVYWYYFISDRIILLYWFFKFRHSFSLLFLLTNHPNNCCWTFVISTLMFQGEVGIMESGNTYILISIIYIINSSFVTFLSLSSFENGVEINLFIFQPLNIYLWNPSWNS